MCPDHVGRWDGYKREVGGVGDELRKVMGGKGAPRGRGIVRAVVYSLHSHLAQHLLQQASCICS